MGAPLVQPMNFRVLQNKMPTTDNQHKKDRLTVFVYGIVSMTLNTSITSLGSRRYNEQANRKRKHRTDVERLTPSEIEKQ